MMCTELELPEIRAWARAELPAYSNREIDQVIQEWSSAPRTRGELCWLERALARSFPPEARRSGWGARTATATT
jgi:hypothetical protein